MWSAHSATGSPPCSPWNLQILSWSRNIIIIGKIIVFLIIHLPSDTGPTPASPTLVVTCPKRKSSMTATCSGCLRPTYHPLEDWPVFLVPKAPQTVSPLPPFLWMVQSHTPPCLQRKEAQQWYTPGIQDLFSIMLRKSNAVPGSTTVNIPVPAPNWRLLLAVALPVSLYLSISTVQPAEDI